MPLEDKRIIVTGAASGIGRATALRAAGEGARVALFDVADAEGEALASEIGGRARYWRVDVADEAMVERGVSEASDWLGGLDVLLNVAGILRGGSVDLDDFPEATWDSVLDINLKGSFIMAKHAARVMRRAGRGVIVLTSSGAGVRGGSSSFAYGASKGGVHGLAMVLAGKLESQGIRVNDVAPGNIGTPLKVAQVQTAFEHTGDRDAYERTLSGLGDPSGVAAVMAFLASDDADYVRGTVFTR